MRMRKKKHGAERLAACSAILCERPEVPFTGESGNFPRVAPIRLEIGCGKGGFSCAMAEKNPNVNFYAMEKVSDVLVIAAERAMGEADRRPDNLRFLRGDAATLPEWFADGALEGIYLNFSDPWPKAGHKKRRLTYRAFLTLYFNALKAGGFLALKTDNDGLFDFTLEELEFLGYTPLWQTRDLHASPYNEGNVMTEYEKQFSEAGKNINALYVIKP